MKLPSLQFGLLTLCSLMLLAIGAAGLLRERWPGGDGQEILEALADEGIDVHSSWLNGALVRLVVFGEPSEETLDKVYALRSLERVEFRPREQTFEQAWNAVDAVPSIGPGSPSLPEPPSPPTAEATLGLAPIEYDLEEAAASGEAPEPFGRTLSDDERRRLLADVMQAWRSARDELGERWTGACGLRTKRLDASSGEWVDDGWMTLEAIVRDGATTATYAYRYGATTTTLRTPEGDLRRDFQFGTWKETVADIGAFRDELGRNAVGDGLLEPPYAGPMRWRRTLFETDPDETFESASLLEEGRFLLRLRPRPLDPLPWDPTDRPDIWGRKIPKPSRIAGGYLIVDPLLEYAVVRSDVEFGYPGPLEETETYRSTIEYGVVQGRTVPISIRECERIPTVGMSQVRLGYEWMRVYGYRWDFDPKLDPAFLTLSKLPARSLRTRTTSQIVWPWATLALGVAGLGFVLVRNVRTPVAPPRKSLVSAVPVESRITAELDEPATPL